MPEMDGFETAAMIRARDRSRTTPIIFLTAVGKTEREVFRGYEVGAVDYLLKPFAPEILRYKVSVLVELHRKNEQIQRLNAELEQRVRDRTAVLEQRSLELARSNQELAQFAAVASHDLQEPLRTMSTYLQMLEKDLQGKLDEGEKQALDVVLDSSRRMRQLIADVLSFSQVGRTPLKLQSVDCGSLVLQVQARMLEQINTKGARIQVGPLPQVRAEPVLLAQVFQNLLSNALKFTTKGRPLVELGAEPEPAGWRLWVRDNGIGIDPSHFEKLFKLFRRLHGRDEYPGSGLGLSICKKIIERHGGRIWLESRPGKGSTFYFTLPKA
jgi:light-regulated signal transduction histidine kinase (bacteriophytochrome)